MPDQRSSLPFEPKGTKQATGKQAVQMASSSPRQEAIPRYVADRMFRRVVVFTGLPTVAGMGVFVGSYLLITRGIADIAPGLTLATSGGFFLLGLVGLSFGVLSSSWDPNRAACWALKTSNPTCSGCGNRSALPKKANNPAESLKPPMVGGCSVEHHAVAAPRLEVLLKQ